MRKEIVIKVSGMTSNRPGFLQWNPVITGIICLLLFFGVAGAQQLRSPVRIADGSLGEILVSDFQQRAVFALDKTSQTILWSFPVKGVPLAVAGWEDLVFIGNDSTDNVEVYQVKRANKGHGKVLKFLYNLGRTVRKEPGMIQRPADMALDTERQMAFVLDGQAANIKVFNFAGTSLGTLPAPGAAPLAFPAAIGVDPVRREILVSDWGDLNATNPRIMIYDYSGSFRDQITPSDVSSEFVFPRPQGLWVNSQGHIFLVDALLNRVVVFDRDPPHTGVKILGGFGTEPGMLQYPLDVTVDGITGDVFVTNNTPGRVEVYRGGGN